MHGYSIVADTIPEAVKALATEARRQAQLHDASSKRAKRKTDAAGYRVRSQTLTDFATILDQLTVAPTTAPGKAPKAPQPAAVAAIAVPADRHAAMKALVDVADRLRPARGFLTPDIPDSEVVNLNVSAGALRAFVDALDQV